MARPPAPAADLPAAQPRPFWTIARRDSAAGLLFAAPQLAGTLVFVLVPLALVFWYSLHEWNVLANTFNYTGARNYELLFAVPRRARGRLATVRRQARGVPITRIGELTRKPGVRLQRNHARLPLPRCRRRSEQGSRASQTPP